MKKKEFIEFLVEECYSNFPELVEKFSKENMYKILNNNINGIRCIDKLDTWRKGSYSTETGIIELYDISTISFDILNKNDGRLKNIVSHEGIHALLKNGIHSTGCKIVRRGCYIKGFAQNNFRNFKSQKTVLEKIKVLAEIPRNYISLYELGRGLNEGFTEWVNLQCTNFSEAYFNELTIIMQLQQFHDKKDILKIGDGNIEQIADLFNMDYSEFNIFLGQVDEMYFNEIVIEQNRKIEMLKEKKDKGETVDISLFKENEISKLTEYGVIKDGKVQLDKIDDVYQREIEPFKKSHKIVATEIQKKLLQKVILPGIKNMEFNKQNSYGIFKTNNLIRSYMESCDIQKEDITEYKEFYEIYKDVLQKHDKSFFETVQKMKDNSEKINLCELNNMFFSHQYTESLPKLWRTSFEIILDREIKEDEVPKVLEEFEELVYLKREKNEKCQFWNSEDFVIEPLKKETKKEQFDNNSINVLDDNEQKNISKTTKKESFFKRLVNKLVTHKQITLEEVNDCELANEKQLENNKGDKSIGEY